MKNYPILFSADSTVFTSYGIGVLKESASCIVTEARNGEFELELKYPTTGKRFDKIKNRCIILAKPSPNRNPQPFRIYKITKPYRGQITVYAQHISYDLSGIPVDAFEAESAEEAFEMLNEETLVSHGFTFSTDIDKDADFANLTPASIRSLFGGEDGSLTNIYGGEWLFDMYDVDLLESRGENNGVTIRYGKNLITLEQEENISELYTGVLPFWFSENDGLVTGEIQDVPGTFDYVRILTKDFSDKHQEPPTPTELNVDAETFIRDNDIGVPQISISTSFADLSKAAGNVPAQSVELCDTVTVIFEKLNISKTSKIIKTEYDALKDEYTNVEIGDVKEDISDTIAEQAAKLKRAPTKSELVKAVNAATALITGNHGGYVVIHDSDGDHFPDEILIMDTEDITTATKVWRWNASGLGYSNHGYGGPYGLAMTIDGSIVANYITSGVLNADSVNVTNINGENIKDKTIGESPMKDHAISYGKTSSGIQSTLTQVGINSADIGSLSASLANLRTALASSITTGSMTINQPSFYYNGAKMTYVGFYDKNGDYHECLGHY